MQIACIVTMMDYQTGFDPKRLMLSMKSDSNINIGTDILFHLSGGYDKIKVNIKNNISK